MKRELLSGIAMLSLLVACSSKQAPVNESKPIEKEEVKTVVNDAIDEFNKFSLKNPIYFAFDSDKVDSKQILSSYKEQLVKIGDLNEVKLTINGYCDSFGSDEYNNKLGKRRAKSVSDVISGKVKNTVKIKLVSFGKSKFKKYSNDMKDNYKKNRKVEIIASK